MSLINDMNALMDKLSTFHIKELHTIMGGLSHSKNRNLLYWSILHTDHANVIRNVRKAVEVLNPILNFYNYEISNSSFKEALSEYQIHKANTILLEITKKTFNDFDIWVKDSLSQEQESNL